MTDYIARRDSLTPRQMLHNVCRWLVYPDAAVPILVPYRPKVTVGAQLDLQDDATFAQGKTIAITYETHNSDTPIDSVRYLIIVKAKQPPTYPYMRGDFFKACEFESYQNATRATMFYSLEDERAARRKLKVFYVHRVISASTIKFQRA